MTGHTQLYHPGSKICDSNTTVLVPLQQVQGLFNAVHKNPVKDRGTIKVYLTNVRVPNSLSTQTVPVCSPSGLDQWLERLVYSFRTSFGCFEAWARLMASHYIR